jgi:hypothetical protein
MQSPDANEMTLDLLTLMASYEGDAISARTKAALAAAKACGIKLGNPRLRAGNATTAAIARAGLEPPRRTLSLPSSGTLSTQPGRGHYHPRRSSWPADRARRANPAR